MTARGRAAQVGQTGSNFGAVTDRELKDALETARRLLAFFDKGTRGRREVDAYMEIIRGFLRRRGRGV